MRSISLFVLAAWLCLAGSVYADDSSTAQSSAPGDQPADAPAPAGPALSASDYSPVVCDPGRSGFRYVEVRGTGFDPWATQRLVGSLVDANGAPQIQWSSVWVSPAGGLTLEVNLCADPFRNRPALPAGDYTVWVGQGANLIAGTTLAVAPPPDPAAVDDNAPDAAVLPAANNAAPTPTPTPSTFVLPNAIIPPTPTPLPTLALPAGAAVAPTATPHTGAGTLQQPYPIGAPGMLADGWQLLITGVTPDAYAGIKAAVPSTGIPAPDQRDYLVRVQATYMGQGTGVFSAMRLALANNVQTTYDQIHNGCGIVPDMVPPNLVTSGGVTRGNVCFAVRVSDVDNVVMFDNQTTTSDRVYFALR